MARQQPGVLLEETGPRLGIEVMRDDAAQFSVLLHALEVFALQHGGDGNEAKLDLEGFLCTFREEAEDIFANTASHDRLGLVSRCVGCRGGRSENPGQHSLSHQGRFVFRVVVGVDGVVLT